MPVAQRPSLHAAFEGRRNGQAHEFNAFFVEFLHFFWGRLSAYGAVWLFPIVDAARFLGETFPHIGGVGQDMLHGLKPEALHGVG